MTSNDEEVLEPRFRIGGKFDPDRFSGHTMYFGVHDEERELNGEFERSTLSPVKEQVDPEDMVGLSNVQGGT